MNEKEFREKAVRTVLDYVMSELYKNVDVSITEEDVYVVWMNKTLQNNKALISTTISDGMYYEVTWDGSRNRGYLDVYRKVRNKIFQ